MFSDLSNSVISENRKFLILLLVISIFFYYSDRLDKIIDLTYAENVSENS